MGLFGNRIWPQKLAIRRKIPSQQAALVVASNKNVATSARLEGNVLEGAKSTNNEGGEGAKMAPGDEPPRRSITSIFDRKKKLTAGPTGLDRVRGRQFPQ
ncbi:hypothetical protein M5K25_009829 [Dendrobium thyrsiflorum]|uniref:Uncharacterized protein n=1 Tax=Dendrobium thyrsiflorum TaxID=117978 RepID=A0ABD0V6F2_DENTH